MHVPRRSRPRSGTKGVAQEKISTVKLARVSNMSSTFNPSALGAIASCEGGKGPGEMGLLCSESTLRRCLNQVHRLALDLGFNSMATSGVGVTQIMIFSRAQ